MWNNSDGFFRLEEFVRCVSSYPTNYPPTRPVEAASLHSDSTLTHLTMQVAAKFYNWKLLEDNSAIVLGS